MTLLVAIDKRVKNSSGPVTTFSIFQFPIMHSVCPPNFARTIVAECSWEYADSETLEYFTTIVYAKFGGQTECIMDNYWKIVNAAT